MTLTITQLTEINEKEAEALTKLSAQLGYQSTVSELTDRTSKILLSPHDCIFVARQNGEIIGWIHAFLAIRVESDLYVEIAGLVVDQDFRKLNLGKQLISAVCDWSKTLGIQKLRVRCNVTRTATHQFYEHLGFLINKQQKIFELAL